ncbi:MAG: hypothetical protein ACOY4O_18600 [Pseudomonadota bacterium]
MPDLDYHSLMDRQQAAKRDGFFGSGDIVQVRTGKFDQPIQLLIENQTTLVLSLAHQNREDGSITHMGRVWKSVESGMAEQKTRQR